MEETQFKLNEHTKNKTEEELFVPVTAKTKHDLASATLDVGWRGQEREPARPSGRTPRSSEGPAPVAMDLPGTSFQVVWGSPGVDSEMAN